jgi:hypothetical protein
VVLSLRRTGLSSPAYRDLLDYVIVEDGRNVGRLYEDRHSRPELRWFWSITVYVNPNLDIVTSRPHAELRRGQGAIPSELGEGAAVTRSAFRVRAPRPAVAGAFSSFPNKRAPGFGTSQGLQRSRLNIIDGENMSGLDNSTALSMLSLMCLNPI